jgi:methylenetetrahydrofolate dehydrogenase (NADP+) / methenyltetrahydrofolate cyclohydrolase
MEKLLYGKPISKSLQNKILEDMPIDCIPTMALIMAGADPASDYYVQNIVRQAGKLGLKIVLHKQSDKISTTELVSIINRYNVDKLIHGIMIQKPLPHQISEKEINNCINPTKDIDGIHPINLGKLFLSEDALAPSTAAAVIELIKHYGIETNGKHVVIIGRSAVVAKPLAGFLLQKCSFGNATVTICHSFTNNLSSITSTADILIAAIGKPNFVKPEMIKENAICIDVGINMINDSDKGTVFVGDMDYHACLEKVSAITPVPGGIGSITTSVLLSNLVKAAVNQFRKKNS